MPGRGRGRNRDSGNPAGGERAGAAAAAAAGGGGSGEGGGGGGAFGDYDEEEVAALEAYMKTHPSKEEDKEALRTRARELSASIGSGQVSPSIYLMQCFPIMYDTCPQAEETIPSQPSTPYATDARVRADGCRARTFRKGWSRRRLESASIALLRVFLM